MPESNNIIAIRNLYTLYKNISKNLFIIPGIIVLITVSCSPVRKIQDDEYLLTQTKIKIDSRKIENKDLKRFRKQVPNRKILGFRFHLQIYNLANPKREKFPSKWFREIGEEPVLYDPLLTEKTTEQFIKYLNSRGYYHASVTDSVSLDKKKAKVNYEVNLNNPYLISSVRYEFSDTGIASIILNDTLNSEIKINKPFDKEVLAAERVRLELLMRELGYYKFNKEFISFEAQKLNNRDAVALTVKIEEDKSAKPDPVTKIRKHRKYYIRDIYIKPENTTLTGNEDEVNYDTLSDTNSYRNSYIVYSPPLKIKPNILINSNALKTDELYELKKVRRTYRNYSTLGLFKLVNIQFDEVPTFTDYILADTAQIDCFIDLTRRKVQSYQVEVVGTNSAGDLGARGNILYRNYNLFRGAEQFRFKLTGAIEALKNRENRYAPLREIGVETGIDFPVFLFPFVKGFKSKFRPKTTVTLSFNAQDRPDYNRKIAQAAYGYNLRVNQYATHTFSLNELNYVKVNSEYSDTAFWDKIFGSYLESSYRDHMIANFRYSFTYTNQQLEKLRDFVYLKLSVEPAGNGLNFFNNLFNSIKVEDSYHIFGVPYFQYIKSDIDFRYYNVINTRSTLVYRIFGGAGYPYGNSSSLPFERKYFAGGPYGIRAWQSNSLGPGSYLDSTSTFANSLGDIKLEANLEYRFKLFWVLESAFFLDAGNIWSISSAEDREGALFEWNTFYDDVAVGTGLGLRFDFSFFLIRTDFGLKLRDPSRPQGNKWIGNMKTENWTIQFGIGYPF